MTILAFLVSGCAASSDYMRPLEVPRMPAPSSDRATVIFVRPSSFAGSLLVTVLDDKGQFIGDALPSSWFFTSVEPGEHTFISWAENTAALRAKLAPGKLYFVEVDVKLGALSARAHLKALGPKSEAWEERDAWLRDSTQLEVDAPSGQAYLDGRREDVEERIRRAHDALAKYSPAELADRTLAPADGIVP
ncbi:MAG: hypothetical protein HOV80_33670 [Polyangiaceae bacterium]|nr:hypothetical protein [Polyangiaceae bacterium]